MNTIHRKALVLALLSAISGASFAQQLPGKHPYYLHALSDLRAARWFLNHQSGDAQTSGKEDVAITEIDTVIGELKKAAIDDGKDLNDHPKVDVAEHGSKLAKAVELLRGVERDVNQEEDDPLVQGLKARALEHVKKAAHIAEEAHNDWIAQLKKEGKLPQSGGTNPGNGGSTASSGGNGSGTTPPGASGSVLPGKHPAYLHALTDLRTARWFLYHQAGDAKVYGGEDVAISEIDATIGEIKRAAIDDGKDVNDHPSVDVKEKGSRLLKGVELLKKVHQDIGQEEDNPEVKELRHHAFEHLDKAIKAAEQAHSEWVKENEQKEKNEKKEAKKK